MGLVVTVAVQAFGWTVLGWPCCAGAVGPGSLQETAPCDSSVVLGEPFSARRLALATALAWFLLLVWAKKGWASRSGRRGCALGMVDDRRRWEPVGRWLSARLQAALGTMWIPALRWSSCRPA